MDKKVLQEMLSEVVKDCKQHEEKFKNTKRFKAELFNDSDVFLEHVIEDANNHRSVNQKLFMKLVSGDGYIYPPKLLASELKSHILRVENLSNFFALMMVLLGLGLSLGLSGGYKVALAAFIFGVLGTVKWNVDQHLTRKKILVNHLEVFPESPKAKSNSNE